MTVLSDRLRDQRPETPGGAMEPGSSEIPRRRFAASAVLIAGMCAFLGVTIPGAAAASQARTPDLVTGSSYLAAPGNLIDGHYYESFPGSADFGQIGRA